MQKYRGLIKHIPSRTHEKRPSREPYKILSNNCGTFACDEIAKGALHQFSLGVGSGGGRSELELPQSKMNQEDSIKQAVKVSAGEFKEYLEKINYQQK